MALMFGSDFVTTTPANSDAIRDGASSIRDVKTRIRTFVSVMFDPDTGLLKTGTTNAPVITQDDGLASMIAMSDNDANDSSRAILGKHIRKMAVDASKCIPGPYFFVTSVSGGNSIRLTLPPRTVDGVTTVPNVIGGFPPNGTVLAFYASGPLTGTNATVSLDAGTTNIPLVKGVGVALTIGQVGGTPTGGIVGGDIVAGQLCIIRYDSANTQWVLVNAAQGPKKSAWANLLITGTGAAPTVSVDSFNAVASVPARPAGAGLFKVTFGVPFSHYAATMSGGFSTTGSPFTVLPTSGGQTGTDLTFGLYNIFTNALGDPATGVSVRVSLKCEGT